jgi:hypothetical protein
MKECFCICKRRISSSLSARSRNGTVEISMLWLHGRRTIFTEQLPQDCQKRGAGCPWNVQEQQGLPPRPCLRTNEVLGVFGG